MKTIYTIEQSHTRPFEYRIIANTVLLATVPLLGNVEGLTRDEANEANKDARGVAERIAVALQFVGDGPSTEGLRTMLQEGGLRGLTEQFLLARQQRTGAMAALQTVLELLESPDDGSSTKADGVAEVIGLIKDLNLTADPAVARLIAEADGNG